jgi:endonuclease/exonuclease/phosphatase family metal-dependent hydrolase
MKYFVISILAGLLLLLSGPCHAAGQKIKVMTFNIRFDNPADGINAWPNRVPLVEEYLKQKSPDIIGIQEALHHQVLELETMLPGYARVGTGRDDGGESGEYSPVFFKKDVFELLNQGQFWLSEAPEVPGSIGPGAVLPRIATWAQLLVKSTGKELFVFNTHYSHVSDKARWFSAQLMSERMKQIAGEKALIVTGDFNLDITGETYKKVAELFLVNNQLINATENEPSFVLTRQGTFNGFGRVDRQTFIDFIFVNPHFRVASSSIDRIKSGDIYISDHWPVKVLLEMK